MQNSDFEPGRLARGMIALAADRAEHVTRALMADALERGDHDRARMWADVLAQVQALSVKAKERAH